MPPVGREKNGQSDRTWAISAQCSDRDWETPATPGKGSLETVGFKLTFAHFCSATKVGRRRPSPDGDWWKELSRRNAENSKIDRTENVLLPAGGRKAHRWAKPAPGRCSRPPAGALPRKRLASSAAGGASPLSPWQELPKPPRRWRQRDSPAHYGIRDRREQRWI